MVYSKIIKIMSLILVITIIYFRDFYYLLILLFFGFLGYKFNLYSKFYKYLNKITGNTKKFIKDKNRKARYLKKLSKYRGSEI